jgi:hypothetical protein
MSVLPRTALCFDYICTSEPLRTEFAQLQLEVHQGGCLRSSLRRIDIATHHFNDIWLLVVSAMQSTAMQLASLFHTGMNLWYAPPKLFK